MAGQARSISLAAAGRPRSYSIALTPLADAMFQLLIFFMLSSSLSPYSLIALTGGAAAGQSAIEGQADATATAPTEADKLVIWHLTRGRVRSGDQSVLLTDLPSVIPSLIAQEVSEVLIFPARSATVQDVATVLELLGSRGVTKVRLVAGSQVGGP
jgi:biopolymer transport protein ExbD